MENNSQKNSIAAELLEKLKSGRIKMKPRAYFVAKTVLFVLIAIVLLLFTIYLISFIVFSLRASGLLFLPRFGFLGLRMLIGPFPWFLILISIGLILLLEFSARHFTFVYRRPIVYSLVGIVFIVIAAGIIIGNTPFHPIIFRDVRDRNIPFIGPFYRGYGAPNINNFYHGIVSNVTVTGFTITTPNNDEFTVVLSPQTRISNPLDEIKEGDIVVVIGDRQGSVVQALFIRKVDEDTTIFPMRPNLRRQPFKQ